MQKRGNGHFVMDNQRHGKTLRLNYYENYSNKITKIAGYFHVTVSIVALVVASIWTKPMGCFLKCEQFAGPFIAEFRIGPGSSDFL